MLSEIIFREYEDYADNDGTEFGDIIGSLLVAAHCLDGFGEAYPNKQQNIDKIMEVVTDLINTDKIRQRCILTYRGNI